MLRREFIASLAALAASPAMSKSKGLEPGLQLGPGAPFNRDDALERARALAAKPYAPRQKVHEDWLNLSYDEFRKIWFDTRNSLWEDTNLPQRLDVFKAGLYFPRPVEISVLSNGNAYPVEFDLGVFNKADDFPDVTIDDLSLIHI